MYLFYILTNRLKAVTATVQQVVNSLIEYINFAEVGPDMVVVPAEMRAAYETGSKGGGGAAPAASARNVKNAPVAASVPKSVAKPAAETIACPSCGKNITVGARKCPHCHNDIEWE